jgi:hypothetical protein
MFGPYGVDLWSCVQLFATFFGLPDKFKSQPPVLFPIQGPHRGQCFAKPDWREGMAVIFHSTMKPFFNYLMTNHAFVIHDDLSMSNFR